MAKISLEQLTKELDAKLLTLVSDYEDYTNLNGIITVECAAGHKIQTSLRTIRSDGFVCNACVGNSTKSANISSTTVPRKNGYRIIGFDNASHNMGIAIFDNGKLVYYTLKQFLEGSAIQRLLKIRDFLEKEVFPFWEPDFVQFEGIQHQKSYATYEVLIKLVGILEMSCEKFGVEYESTRSVVWRAHHAINNKNREADKRAAIQKVREMYDIQVGDDVAEAILIAKYRSDMMSRQKMKDLF